MVPGSDLLPGMTVELYGTQELFDFNTRPLRSYTAGDRLVVKRVAAMATGRQDRQPYEVVFDKDGSEVELELESGTTAFLVVD